MLLPAIENVGGRRLRNWSILGTYNSKMISAGLCFKTIGWRLSEEKTVVVVRRSTPTEAKLSEQNEHRSTSLKARVDHAVGSGEASPRAHRYRRGRCLGRPAARPDSKLSRTDARHLLFIQNEEVIHRDSARHVQSWIRYGRTYN